MTVLSYLTGLELPFWFSLVLIPVFLLSIVINKTLERREDEILDSYFDLVNKKWTLRGYLNLTTLTVPEWKEYFREEGIDWEILTRHY